MKLLYLVPDDAFFWSHRLALAAAARDAGCEVVIATPPGRLRGQIENAGFRFQPVAFARSLAPAALARTVRDVVALYQRERPDLVHHVSMRAVLCGGLAARVARVPAVVNLVTGLGWVYSCGPRLLKLCVEQAYRAVLRDPRNWTVFQNPDDRSEFVARGLVARERSSVILGSGVDTRLFRPTAEPPGPPRVLLASRMLRPKGVADLVAASRLLRARGIAHELVLAGEPDPKNPSSLTADELRAWHRAGDARWLGRADDMPALISAAHVACLPSYYREGVPKFLLEALASARAIVTTDTPGCRLLVPDGASGVLVPPRQPAALAAALEELFSDAAVRARKGAAGRRLVEERFALEAVLEQTFGVYRGLTGWRWPAPVAPSVASVAEPSPAAWAS